MGRVDHSYRQPVRMGTRSPKPRSESSISRRIFRTVKKGVSSGVNSVLAKFRSDAHPPLVENVQSSNSQNSESRESTMMTLDREERLAQIGKLLEQITQKQLFWEQDIKPFFGRINEVFDPGGYGPEDVCNQNCCKAVVGIAHFLYTDDEKWVRKLRGFGAPKYFGWAAMNSAEDNVRRVALMFLIKSEGKEAVNELTGGQI